MQEETFDKQGRGGRRKMLEGVIPGFGKVKGTQINQTKRSFNYSQRRHKGWEEKKYHDNVAKWN